MTSSSIRKICSFFFFISGFCSLLYQVVWVRLAFAHFGINTPVLSVVLSVFMAGLALGSWIGGRLSSGWPEKNSVLPLRFYGSIELLTGFGAILVPRFFDWGSFLLLPLGSADSTAYLFSSALVLTLSLLPWCLMMGTTFPFMTAFLKTVFSTEEGFSFLYKANVLGAMAGVLVTATVLIECLGFHRTLLLGASLNAFIGLISLWISRNPIKSLPPRQAGFSLSIQVPETERHVPYLPILFTTGFVSMALEVVWTRAYTFVLSTLVYSYASLLFSYLLATFLGSWFYRWHLKRGRYLPTSPLLGAVFAFSFLPMLLNDARLPIQFFTPLISLMPMCAVWGYLTPKLIDQFSKGNPRAVGKAYAANILGCILGPLAASYFLLPGFSCRVSMIFLSLPLGFFFLVSLWKKSGRTLLAAAWTTAFLILALAAVGSMDNEEAFLYFDPQSVIHRDYTATTISKGSGMAKELYVNGIGITALCMPTKMMAHLPLVFLSRPPQSVLDICFGMGTTFRSLMSWGCSTTAVDLVPSVFQSFPFYFSDAQALRSNPNAHWVVDDGRRFLQRTSESYELITIDPPPPVEAAGSSLLYSTGFYDLAKKHLKKDGLLQQWIPNAEYKTVQAVCRSLVLSFPYVRVFAYPHGNGTHFIASLSPIPPVSPREMVHRMPSSAKKDLLEWLPGRDPEVLFQIFMSHEMDPQSLLTPDPRVAVTDDQPYNEYFLVRRFAAKHGLSL